MVKILSSVDCKKSRRRHKIKLAISFSVGVISLSLLLFTLLIDLVPLVIKIRTSIYNGSAFHEFLKKDLDTLHVSVYLFNITNAEQFLSGDDQKLRVNEVGPFTYKEMRTNENIKFDEEKKVMTYSPRIDMVFMPEQSIGNPEEMNVTLPNIPMLGLTARVSAYPYIAQVGFDVLVAQLRSKPIVTMDAKSYMWGYEEPLVSLGHTFMPGSIKFENMGIMDRVYDKQLENNLEVSIDDDSKLMILKRNGCEKLRMSPSDDDDCELCSTFNNTYEGIAYPSGLTTDFPVRLFKNGLCRVIELDYYGMKKMPYGGEAMVYYINDNLFKFNSEDNFTGILPLPDCFYGLPLAISKVHLLDVDPKIYENIEGLHPDKHRFKNIVTIEPKLGIELETSFSLQMNLVVGDISRNPDTKRFSNMVLPICFFTVEQPPLDANVTGLLKFLYTIYPLLMLITQIILYLITFLSWVYFVSLVHRSWACSQNNPVGITFPVTTLVKPMMYGIDESIDTKT